MKMALLTSSSSPTTTTTTTTPPSLTSSKPHSLTFFFHKSYLNLKPTKTHFSIRASTSENGSTTTTTTTTTAEEVKVADVVPSKVDKTEEVEEDVEFTVTVNKFKDSRWVNGTWDLKQFQVNGSTNWDSVIDAEAKRRKWLETYPESTSNDEPIIFDTSIIPWWAWVKRFHLPEAELLNGRAAMVGFFMSYFVDSLTGLGVVDQMSNFFCKTLLFASVLGILFIRKNEDVENLKKLFEETTFYDKQWQATWQEDTKKN